MSPTLQPSSNLKASDLKRHKTLIFRVLAVSCLNILALYFFSNNGAYKLLFLLSFLGFLGLFAIVYFFDAINAVAHTFLAVSFALLSYGITQSGGVNSPFMAWMPLIPVFALMMLNFRWCYIWLAFTLVHHAGQFVAVQGRWINAEMNAHIMTPTMALMIKINLILLIMLAITWYEITFRATSERLTSRTQKLNELQSTLKITRAQVDMYLSALGNQLRLPLRRLSHLVHIPGLETAPNDPLRVDSLRVQDTVNHLNLFINDLVLHAQSETENSVDEKISDRAASSFRILLLSDQANELSVLRRTLRNLWPQCEVGLAESTASALLQLEISNFDLVIIELEMRGMNGIEATRQIRSHAKHKVNKAIVIGLVPQSSELFTDDCLAAGMQWLIFRPYTEKILFHALSAQLT